MFSPRRRWQVIASPCARELQKRQDGDRGGEEVGWCVGGGVCGGLFNLNILIRFVINCEMMIMVRNAGVNVHVNSRERH